MRGTLVAAHQFQLGDRFIPAHAGNSPAGPTTPRPTPVHPRACGELDVVVVSNVKSCGSSPRMRGTLMGTNLRPSGGRFIPAHAGNSRKQLLCAPRGGLHEGNSFLHSSRIRIGSSPRMRGTLGRTEPPWAGSLRGIIGWSRFTGLIGSSPRMRGTHAQPSLPAVPATGSSPRMRGTPRIGSSPRMRGTRGVHRPTGCTVHPRACGELRLPAGLLPSSSRFIPAHAGNSSPETFAPWPRTVHPRACGELRSGVTLGVGMTPVHPRACGELRR